MVANCNYVVNCVVFTERKALLGVIYYKYLGHLTCPYNSLLVMMLFLLLEKIVLLFCLIDCLNITACKSMFFKSGVRTRSLLYTVGKLYNYKW
jgi:hypothetical protein